MDKIRIIIADQHAYIRDGIKRILIQHPNIVVVAEASTGQEVLEALEHQPTDVLLTAMVLSGTDGFDVTKMVQERHLPARILFMTAQLDFPYIDNLLEAGVSGYILKGELLDNLILAIHRIASGGVWFTQFAQFINPHNGSAPSIP